MAGDICAGILVGGAFDSVVFEQNNDYQLKVRNFVLSSSFEAVDRARRYGLSVDAIVKSLPINVSGEFNEQNFRQWQQQSLQQYSLNETQAESISFFQTTANSEIVAAWTACVTSQPATGLTSFAEALNDNLVKFSISWIPSPGDLELPQITGITITGGVLRNAGTYFVGATLRLGYRINILLVERGQESGVGILVNTTKGDVFGSSSIPRSNECESCKGLKRIECITCKGERRVSVPNAPDWARRICSTCQGLGDIVCLTCNGSGLHSR